MYCGEGGEGAGLELGECVFGGAFFEFLVFFYDGAGGWGGGFGWGGVVGDFADHLSVVDAELGAAGISYGDVKGFDDEFGATQVDVVAGQGVDDFHERGLDGLFIFDEGDGVETGVGWSFDAAQHALVEVAELLSTHGGASALDAGDFDVLAGGDVFEIGWSRGFRFVGLVGRHGIWTSKNEMVFG